MSVIDAALAAHPKDLPGVGPLDQPATNFARGLFASKEGLQVSKAAKRLQLAYRNLVTGSAASTEEDKRISDAGADPSTEQSFRAGYELMKKGYQDLVARTYAGHDPRAVQTFISRAPEYEIPGHPLFSKEVSVKAAPTYTAPLDAIQPPIVSGPAAPAPSLPTSVPVVEPGGAPAPVPVAPKPAAPPDAKAVLRWALDPANAKDPRRAAALLKLKRLGLLPGGN
jgi:hypothetical protein